MNEPIDISPGQRKELLDLIMRHLPNVEVWAFGSRVKWTARSNSDLDLVAFARPEDEGRVSRLKEALEESSLPFRVDLLVWDKIPESFQKNIRDRYVVMIGKKESTRDLVKGSDWETYTLGELGSIRTGRTPPFSLGDGFGGTIPFVTPGDMNGQKWITETDRNLNEIGLSAVRSSLMPARSVAVSCIGSDMGKAVLLAKPSVTNQQINTIAVDESRFNAEFVYYDLSVRQQELKAAASGSATPILNKGHFSGFEISIPPRATQDKIVDILGRLDEKIDLNRRINQTLEAMAQAIFKSWFVDFDPVKAKIAAIQQGRDPLRAAMSAISGKADAELDALPREQFDQLAATAALFPNEMEESELGEIPSGWHASPFGSLLVHTIGGDWGKDVPDSSSDTRVAIIRGTDIPDLEKAQTFRVPIRYTTTKKLASRQLQVGDIVLEVSGGSKDQPTGRSIRITANTMREFDCPVEPASFCRLLRPTSPQIGVILGLHLARIYVQGKTWEYQNQSTGIANFQTAHFLEAELVANPPTEIAQKFYDLVTPLLERRHDAQSRRLATLRDTLLPKLLSGELSITEVDAEAEA